MRKYDKIKNKKTRKGRYAMFKRKIYNKMQEWKKDSNGKTALLIEGARRIGKSTVVEEADCMIHTIDKFYRVMNERRVDIE